MDRSGSDQRSRSPRYQSRGEGRLDNRNWSRQNEVVGVVGTELTGEIYGELRAGKGPATSRGEASGRDGQSSYDRVHLLLE